MTWTFIPTKLCLIYDGGLISLHCLNFDRSMNWIIAYIVWISSGEMIQCLKCWLELIFSFWILNCYSCRNCLLVDLNRYFWTIEPLSERLNFDRWLDQIFPRNCLIDRWTEISFWILNWYSCRICLIVDLNRYFWTNEFNQWLEPLFPRNGWTVIPEWSFEFWSMTWVVIPAKLLNRYPWANVWTMIWANIPPNLLTWANVWIVIQ